MTPEERKIYNKNYQEKRKQEKKKHEEEKAVALEDINRYVEMDAKGKYFLGETSCCVDLWKIYNGVDLEEDPFESPYKKDKKKIIKVFELAPVVLKHSLTFDEWIEGRRFRRSDMWVLMHSMGRGKWHEPAHRILADFFPKKDNSKLPLNYTQDEMLEIIGNQDPQHDCLLLFPRQFRKTTVNILDAIQWIINFPDISILFVSSTKSLGIKILRELIGYFSVNDYNNPSEFQLFFPEFCKAAGSGNSREFKCPRAHLGLKDNTVSFSSVETGGAGTRCDILKFDDAVDEQNYLTVEQRQKVNSKFDAMYEFLTVPFGHCHLVGTRYTDGQTGDAVEDGRAIAVPDLYKLTLDRNDDSKGKNLKVLKREAWTVKDEIGKTSFDKTLTEDEVDLLCPFGPGTFKELHKKLLKNPMWFRCQQLNQPVAEVVHSTYINTFTEENLRTCTYQYSMAPKEGDLLIAWDTAMTDKKTSDYSCGAAVRVYKDDTGRFGLSVLEITFERWSQLETAQRIVSLCKKWNPKNTRIERLPGAELFVREVNRQMLLQDYRFDVFWAPPDPKPNAKRNRIMGLQTLHAKGLFQIVSGPWIDETYKQLTQYTGEKSNKGRKDEIPDVLGHLTLMLPPDEGSPEALLYQAAQEAQIERGRKSAEYNQIFSSTSINPSVQPALDLMTDNGRGEMNIPCAPKYGIPGLRR